MSELPEQVPARMKPDIEAKKPDVTFDNDMWFLPVFDGREQAAVKMAYEYAKLGQPGLPDHLYLKVIYGLCELLRQIDVELMTDGED